MRSQNYTLPNGWFLVTEISPHLIEKLHLGEVIVFPTSTQPGLACLPNAESLNTLFSTKSRDADKPVSIGVSSLEDVVGFVHIPEYAADFIDSFPAGSLTLLLDAVEEVDARIGGNRIAVRVFSHPVAKALAKVVGPITATSANLAGQEVEGDVFSAAKSLGLGPDSVLQGECEGGKPSTLVRFETENIASEVPSVIVMREGVVSIQDVVAWQPKER